MRTLITVLLLSVGAFAQGGFYQDRAEGRLINGNTLVAIPGAAVTVCSDQACVSPVNIYSNADLAIGHLIGTSTTADANGNFSFYVLPGQYFCQVSASGFSTAINPCQVSITFPLLSLSIGDVGSPPVLSEDSTSCCTGFLAINSGLHINSSLVIDSGALQLNQDETYTQYKDGGHSIFVQAGPRGKESTITAVSITSNVLTVTGAQREAFSPADVVYLSSTKESFLNGQTVTVSTSNGTTQFTAAFTHANFTSSSELGEAVTSFLKADSTVNLPDLAQGSSTPNSGYILGMPGTDYANASGNCVFDAGSNYGVMQNSGFGCNTHIVFPTPNNRFVEWLNGVNSISLTGAAATGSRLITLPDATGTAILSIATGTATVDLASVASGACTADSSDVTLTGAAVGDPVRVTAATALPAGVWLIGRVTASNTGRFQLCNLSGGAVDRASDTYTISVVK